VADRLAQLAAEHQVVVLCGTNAALLRQIETLDRASAGRVRGMPFTPHVDLLLEAWDLVVSKAGGLTCSEALAKHTPLVVFRPTPGQEVKNTEFLESAGAARHVDTIDDVAAAVGELLDDRDAADRMREVQARPASWHSAETYAGLQLSHVPDTLQRSAA